MPHSKGLIGKCLIGKDLVAIKNSFEWLFGASFVAVSGDGNISALATRRHFRVRVGSLSRTVITA